MMLTFRSLWYRLKVTYLGAYLMAFMGLPKDHNTKGTIVVYPEPAGRVSIKGTKDDQG